MKTALCPNGRSLAACLVLVLSPWLGFAAGFEATVVQTNGLDRWITNVVEVRMPVNHFVNQYHTNHIEVVRTNVVAFYATNWVTRLHTNIVWLNVPRTNWVSTVRTNTVVLEAVKTNFVVAYQTNLKTLNLTNWKTVLILKTTWVIQPITNVAEI